MIRRLGPGEDDAVLAAGHLFDDPPRRRDAQRFLAEPTHHLLLAAEDGRPIGFVSGVEVTHPDKGTEMLLLELGVDPPSRRRGVGRALVEALAGLATSRGCHGMFVLVDGDNAPALATYATAGGREASRPVMLEWELGPGR